jgi:hypothetical protein
MPVHDWAKVPAGTFHHFHTLWLTEISNALNAGILPRGYYAMAEQVAGGLQPDVLALEEILEEPVAAQATGSTATMLLAAESPPQVRYTIEDESLVYALKADHLAIRHVSGDRVVGFIEIVSPGNKHSATMLKQFFDKLSDALSSGCHLLVIDLHRPSKFDPEGLPAAFWGATTPSLRADEPFSLSAYRAGAKPTAHVEPVGLARTLPDFPLFLTADQYVYVPLETAYQAAWRGMPQRWKRVIDT